MKQILLNLLENSIKFTKSGGRLRLAITEEQLEAVYSNTNTAETISALRFEIEDNGIGIEENQIPYLFKKHSDPSSTSICCGGSGLSLSQTLLKAMLPKGIRKACKIKVKTLYSQGSTFSFLLPLSSPQTLSTASLPQIIDKTSFYKKLQIERRGD